MKNTIVAVLGALTILLAACGDPADAGKNAQASAGAGDSTLGAMIGTIEELSIASEVIGNAELEDPFEGAGAYTIFLPRDEAFEELPEEEEPHKVRPSRLTPRTRKAIGSSNIATPTVCAHAST